MSTLPVELMICYSVVISLSFILKIVSKSEKLKQFALKIKSLKNTVENSIKNNSISDLNSIISDYNDIHLQLLNYDIDIVFELPD